MGIVSVEGIITREIKYGDSSRILTLLTRQLGKISVLAGGVRSNKSGLLAATQLFSHVEFQLFHGREKSLYKINSGTLLTSFSPIRDSLTKLAYASYFCEVGNDVIQENAPDEEQINLLLNALYLLAADKLPEEQIKGVYEFRTLALQGLLPELTACSLCEEHPPVLFHPLSGECRCKNCAPAAVDSSWISGGEAVLSAVDYIHRAESKKVFSFSLNGDSLTYLSRLGEYCLELYLEKHFKTLDYLKNVQSL